jgi:MFS family permease
VDKSSNTADRRTFAAGWLATFFVNIAWGITFPLKNIYIHDQDISLVLIGTLATAGAISFSLGSFGLARVSDVLQRRKVIIIVALLLSTISSIFYLIANSYPQFLALSIIDMVMAGGYAVLIDTVITSVLPQQTSGRGFGAYRISGSIGFALAAILIGPVTEIFEVRAIFVIGAVGYTLAAIAASFMLEKRVADGQESETKAHSTGSTLQTLILTGLIWLVIADFIAIAGEQAAYPFLNIYIQDELGATNATIGLLSTIRVLAEIPAMLGLGRLSDRVGRAPVLIYGFAAITLSWLLIYLAPDLTLIFIGLPLAGSSIVRYTVGVSFISDRVPNKQRATVMGLINMTFGVGGIIAPTLGGMIAENFGARNTFALALFIGIFATLLFITVVRLGKLARPQVREVAISTLEEAG